jgi:hypothetical protein
MGLPKRQMIYHCYQVSVLGGGEGGWEQSFVFCVIVRWWGGRPQPQLLEGGPFPQNSLEQKKRILLLSTRSVEFSHLFIGMM